MMPGLKLETDGLWHLFFLDAQDEQERPIMPRIWPQDRIDTFIRRNPERYWAQVRNNPTQTPYNVLPRSYIERMVVDKFDVRGTRVSLHFDTAFKSPRRKARGDYSVISAVAHEPKTGVCVFLGANGSTEWDSEKFGKELVASINKWRGLGARVVCMTDEADIGGKPGVWQAFILTVLRSAGVQNPPELITLTRDTKRKSERLANVAALWRDGRMKLLKDAPGLETLIDQMTKIGKSDHEDYADATADCFNSVVYSVIWPKGPGEGPAARISANPFDDVLKPTPEGAAAAERIAKMYDDAQAVRWMENDVVVP